MNALLDLFSPLGKEWCGLFYVLTIFSFILFVLSIVGAVNFIFTQKKLSLWMVVGAIVALVLPFIQYISVRLLFSMCAASL